ncbi:proline--tRNA ligase [Thalassospiraceae bacterium LMO-JJ14]|nr:proline--tRNA ligase [Thalassospiraceae bacterium LMO-JJ14]
MKASQIGIQVLREMPSDADDLAAAWLIRGGYIHRHASGIFTFAPLIYRVEKKVSDIINEEITRFGGIQVRFPLLQSAEIWKQSGRWAVYEHANLMFQSEDRRGRLFGLSPTAEEVACDLGKHLIRSPNQLPLNVFQNHMKFRDELRPRSGLLRSREFIMMDAYSFDIDEDGLDLSYRKMRQAYHAIYKKMGFDYIVVQADSGAIGGSASEEFMAVSEAGEDTLLYTDEGYAANLERAMSEAPAPVKAEDGEMEIIDTPDSETIKKVADFVGVHPSAVLKTLVFDLVYQGRVEQVVVLIRGDCDVNEVKLGNHFGAIAAQPSDADTVRNVTGCEPGYVGPIGIKAGAKMIADTTIAGLTSLVSGCCEKDRHAIRVCPGRDFEMPEVVDLRTAHPGEIAPNGQPLQQCKGIEIGHVFKLGTKYSEPLNAGVIDSNQVFQNFHMGCYGIGTTRILQTIVDQNCDAETGIKWPVVLAPFHAHLIPVKADNPEMMQAAEDMGAKLEALGCECIVDDRKGSLGSKLKDADILGMPLRVVFGRDLADGKVEIYNRLTDEKDIVLIDDAIERLAGFVRSELDAADARRDAVVDEGV